MKLYVNKFIHILLQEYIYIYAQIDMQYESIYMLDA